MAELAMTRKYAEDVSIFRADVILKHMSLGLPTDANSWSYYELERESPGNYANLETKDVLIICNAVSAIVHNNPVTRPHIRIFSTEQFELEDVRARLTIDATVDHEADSQYVVGSATISSEGIPTVAFVPLYGVHDGELSATEMGVFTCVPLITGDINGVGSVVRPFGHYNRLMDKVGALDVARGLFNLIATQTPAYTSRP
jgi:hypothetical protein